MIVIATAAWSVPRARSTSFPGEGSHLQRYARVFRGAEINSSFYRDHTPETYARWAASTPRLFRFAVKVPRLITHEQRLKAARRPLEQFLGGLAGLGRRLGPLLVQLPPSLAFEPNVARRFFALVRERHTGPIVCEPRHPTWFEPSANTMLVRYQIGRVAADPAVTPAAAQPAGWSRIAYYRLHGSPRQYWSVYDKGQLTHWADALRAVPRGTLAWCVFDNTAGGGAAGNALKMREMLEGRQVRRTVRAK